MEIRWHRAMIKAGRDARIALAILTALNRAKTTATRTMDNANAKTALEENTAKPVWPDITAMARRKAASSAAATRLAPSQTSAMILEFAHASQAFTARNAILACRVSSGFHQKAAKPATARRMAPLTLSATKTESAFAKKELKATSATNAREIIFTKKTRAAKSATIATISSNLNTTSTRMSSTG